MFCSYEILVIFCDWLLLNKINTCKREINYYDKLVILININSISKFTNHYFVNDCLFNKHKSASLLNISFYKYGLDINSVIDILYNVDDDIFSNTNNRTNKISRSKDIELLRYYKSLLMSIFNMYYDIDYGFQKFNKIIYSYKKDTLCPFKNLPIITYRRFNKQIENSINLSLALDYPYKRISINLIKELDDYY